MLNELARMTPYADVTLLLGAESFLQGARHGIPPDPWAKDCFTMFVNLAVNSPVIRYPLPQGGSDSGHGPRWTLPGSATWRLRIEEAASSDGTAEAIVEERVAVAFDDRLDHWDSQYSDWVQFQLLHPLVAAQHSARVGTTEVPGISNEGLHYWQTYRKELWSRYLQRQPLRALEPAIRSHHSVAVAHFNGSPAEFAVCYAYDVFRRGWAYQGRAAAAAASYVPHEYRNAALEKSAKWHVSDQIRGLTFSWGKYFARLVHEYPSERSVSRIAQRIDDVRRVCEELLIMPWVHAYIQDVDPSQSPDDWEAFAGKLLSIEAAARKAGLPLLAFDKEPGNQLLQEALGASMWAFLHERLAHVSTNAILIILGLELTYLLLKETTSIGILVQQEYRNEANVVSEMLHRVNQFGFPDLLPHETVPLP